MNFFDARLIEIDGFLAKTKKQRKNQIKVENKIEEKLGKIFNL